MTESISLLLTWDEAEALNMYLNVRSGFLKLAGQVGGPEREAAERACGKLHQAVTGAPSSWGDFLPQGKGE